MDDSQVQKCSCLPIFSLKNLKVPSNQDSELTLRITAMRKPKQALEAASCEAPPDLVRLPSGISSFISL